MYTDGHCQILSTGVSIPTQIRTSESIMEEIDSENRFGLSHKWLSRATGIKTRHWENESREPSDMAADAAIQALEYANTLPKEVDMIIFAGVIRDHFIEPSTAHIVQNKIGAVNAVVLDMNNACLGFMSAVHIMDALISTGQVKRGLVVTGEQGSKLITNALTHLKNTRDRSEFDRLACGLTLGDAGAALVLGPKTDNELGVQGFNMYSQGEHAKLCYCGDTTEMGVVYTDMVGILEAGKNLGKKTFVELMEGKLNWQTKELDHFVGHQVGRGSLKVYKEVFGVTESKISQTVWDYGNIITATIPLNLHKLIHEKKIDDGNKVFLAGAGSGVSSGHAGMVWSKMYH